MFLSRAGLLVASAMPILFLSGCALRYDTSHAERRRPVETRPEVPGNTCPDPLGAASRGPKTMLAGWSGHPDSEPSYREQREARALVRAMENNRRAMGEHGATALFTNDGASSRAHDVKFLAETGALSLAIDASPCLNFAEGASHALSLVIYHLSDRAALDQLADSDEGMKKLLEGKAFDKAALAVRRLDIQPGMQTTLSLDRPENGRYVAVVAGYHRLSPGSCRVFSYPIGQYVQPVKNSLFKAKVAMFAPQPLDLHIQLGEDAMSAAATPARYDNMLESVKMSPRVYAWAR